MATYIGYYRVNEGWAAENAQHARNGTGVDQAFFQKVVELPGKLPDSVSVIGSYSPMGSAVLGPQPPSVMIVDAADPTDLSFITQYYAGYLQFQWMPAQVVGASRAQRETWRAQATQPAAVR